MTHRSRSGAPLLAGLFVAAATLPAGAQESIRTEHYDVRAVTVADGLNTPWGMAFLPNGDILVTEKKPGTLRIVRGGKLDAQPIAGVPEVWNKGQGGLLDVAVHPQFATNRMVYLSYSKPGPQGATTAVIRGRLEGNQLAGVEEIFEADGWSEKGQHFGSRLAFDRNGYLFVSVGDRGTMENAQDITNSAGKIHRLHDDGRIPQDNPFVGRPGAEGSIYSYGNRNPQGMIVHPTTGEVWVVEHGPRGGDEVNWIRPGRNYGWPTITYGINYNGTKITDITAKEGMEQPLHYWVPSIATSGMTMYTGDKFPDWKGDLLVGGMAGMQVARVRFDGTRPVVEEKMLGGMTSRIRDVRTGPDGYVYLLVDSPEAPLIRLEPA